MQIFIYTYVLCLSLFPLCHSLNLSILSQCQTQMFTETWHFTHYWKGLNFSWMSGTEYPHCIQTMEKCTYNTLQHTVATEMWWFSVCQRKHTPDQQNMMLCSFSPYSISVSVWIHFLHCLCILVVSKHGSRSIHQLFCPSFWHHSFIIWWYWSAHLLLTNISNFNLSPPPTCWAKS